MMTRGFTISSGLAVAMMATVAQAQQYSVSWYTVDGGGGALSGGAFTAVATVGQADAGAMSGGAFELSGGFWPGPGAAGDDCNGSEKIASAKCKTKRGETKKAIVKMTNGTPGLEYTATLDTGQQITLTAKGTGKATFKFKGGNKPDCGPTGVTITPCGLQAPIDCNCG